MFLFLSSSKPDTQPNDSVLLNSRVSWFNSKSHTRLLPFALGWAVRTLGDPNLVPMVLGSESREGASEEEVQEVWMGQRERER